MQQSKIKELDIIGVEPIKRMDYTKNMRIVELSTKDLDSVSDREFGS